MSHTNPASIYQQLTEAGDTWADAHEAAEMLRETQKILKAKLMKQSGEKSISAKELDAISSKEYDDHVKLAVEATGAEARAKVRYERVKILADLWRTQNANQRAAMRDAT